MKRFSRFSFGQMLRNDRLMMVCSLLLAIVVWYFVISGSSNITTRTITCTLNTANVSNGALQVIEEQTITVDVVVEGAWSDILELTAEDIRVQLNTSDIRAAGKCRLNVVAGQNSQKGGYTILSTSPSIVTLFCDEWVDERMFSVATGQVIAEAPAVSKVEENQSVNVPIFSDAALPGGVLFVQGPRTEVDRIAQLVATVDDEMQLSEKHVFSGDIVAKDGIGEDGAVLDLKYSQFLRYDKDPAQHPGAAKIVVTALDVLVTLNERQELAFTYDVLNAPTGVDVSALVMLHPASVIIEGEQELVQACLANLTKLSAVDFDNLSMSDRELPQRVVFPAGITVIGNEDNVSKNENGESVLTVTRKMNWSGYSYKTLTWELGTDLNNTPITFENVPEGFDVLMATTRLEVMVIGASSAIRNLTAEDLSAIVRLEEGNLGTYAIRPKVDNPNVWVYYGAADRYTIHVNAVDAASAQTE